VGERRNAGVGREETREKSSTAGFPGFPDLFRKGPGQAQEEQFQRFSKRTVGEGGGPQMSALGRRGGEWNPTGPRTRGDGGG